MSTFMRAKICTVIIALFIMGCFTSLNALQAADLHVIGGGAASGGGSSSGGGGGGYVGTTAPGSTYDAGGNGADVAGGKGGGNGTDGSALDGGNGGDALYNGTAAPSTGGTGGTIANNGNTSSGNNSNFAYTIGGGGGGGMPDGITNTPGGNGGGTYGGAGGGFVGGGGGGSAMATTTGDYTVTGNVVVKGGNGGGGGTLGQGGGGGAAELTLDNNLTVDGNFTLTGGTGGGGTYGGGGGEARFDGGANTLTMGGNLTITNGNAGNETGAATGYAGNAGGSNATDGKGGGDLGGLRGNGTAAAQGGGVSFKVNKLVLSSDNRTGLSKASLNINISGTNSQTGLVDIEETVIYGHTDIVLTGTDTTVVSVSLGNLVLDGTGTLKAKLCVTGYTLDYISALTIIGTGTEINDHIGGGNSVILPSDKTLNFYIPEDIATNIATPMLKVANKIKIDNNVINLYGLNNLQNGQSVILINGVANDSALNPLYDAPISTQSGVTSYQFQLNLSGDQLTAQLIDSAFEPDKAGAYAEGAAAGLALVNGGADAAVTAIGNAFPAGGSVVEGTESVVLLYVGGNKYRVKTGSYVDATGFHLLTGPGLRFGGPYGTTTIGVFFETGWGDYNSHNSFASGSVKGKGNARYYGGGAGLRYESAWGPYVETSLRGGVVESDFKSRQLNSRFSGLNMTYWSLHAGVGAVSNVCENGTMDVYAKMLWSHQGNERVTTSAGEKLSFEDTNSLRMRIGARYKQDFTPSFLAYIGAAAEYEFDGNLRGKINGARIPDAPNLKGASGLFETGIKFCPTDSNWQFGLTGEGAVGKRVGFGGSFSISYCF